MELRNFLSICLYLQLSTQMKLLPRCLSSSYEVWVWVSSVRKCLSLRPPLSIMIWWYSLDLKFQEISKKDSNTWHMAETESVIWLSRSFKRLRLISEKDSIKQILFSLVILEALTVFLWKSRRQPNIKGELWSLIIQERSKDLLQCKEVGRIQAPLSRVVRLVPLEPGLTKWTHNSQGKDYQIQKYSFLTKKDQWC